MRRFESTSGLSVTIKGDSPDRLVFNTAESQQAAIKLDGTNDGTVINRITANATSGASALLIEDGQNGINVENNKFGGTTSAALVFVDGAFGGGSPTTGVNFLGSTVAPSRAARNFVTEATGSQVKGNLFTGTASGAELDLRAAGADVQQNTFSATGAPHILELGECRFGADTDRSEQLHGDCGSMSRAATACSRR